MDLATAGLHKHTFALHGMPLTFVPNRSHQAALEYLVKTYSHDCGPGVLEGPALIGKSTVVRRFIKGLPSTTAVAFIDCSKLNDGEFLDGILARFGFQLGEMTEKEKLKLLDVFLARQVATFRASLLILDNAHDLCPSAYHALGQLFKIRHHGRSALRAVLVGDRSLDSVIDTLKQGNVDQPASEIFVLEPMTATETENYLDTKLQAGGCERPETIVSAHLCEEIFEKSEGYAGLVDWHLLLRLKQADKLPLSAKHEPSFIPEHLPLLSVDDIVRASKINTEPANVPELFFTLNGKLIQQVKLTRSKFLIGRADSNDVTIDSPAVSRHHALLIRQGGSILLIDLNSTNGVFVNSKRVTSRVLRHDDVISLGNHGLRISDVHSRRRDPTNEPDLEDTKTMQAMDSIRLNAMSNTGEVQTVAGH